MKNKKVLCFICLYNEARSIRAVLESFGPDLFGAWIDELIVIDDCSTDGSFEIARQFPYTVIRHEHNRGVGGTFKTAIAYARTHGFDYIISFAGNGKMRPAEIPDLLRPVFEQGYDFVQGSRYMAGGRRDHIPAVRYLIQRAGSFAIQVLFGWPGDDVSCGLRAVSMRLFDHPSVRIDQPWLERYGLESYIQCKAVMLRFRIKQVPASMIYPADRRTSYTKIPSFTGWWDMAYPWIALRLKLRT